MASKAAPAKKVVAKKAAPKKSSAITTKSQILAALAATGEISKKQATAVYEALLAIAYVGAKQPKGIVLPGLGKLIKVKRPARMGRNPATGATIKIPAKTVVKFRVAKAAKDMILK
jgi:DNA-binding protein HU-beta